MAKKITKDEIFEKGLLSDVIKDANEAIQVFDKLDTELLKVSKSYKAIIDNSSKNSKGSITELINASKQLNQITEQTVLIEKEKLKVDQQLRISKKEQLSAEQSLQRQREKGIAQMEREARKVAEAERPYNKMSATLNDLRKKYKDLAVSGNENTASARAMKREIDSLDKTLKKVDGSAGQFQRNVGNYPQTFKAIGSALGQLGLAFGVFSSIKGIAETEIKLQSLQLALKNVMGTQERYNQSFSFLSKLSRDYGQDLTVLVDTYKGFIASSESSNLSLEARNKIYQSVIKSGSSLALSNDQIQGSLLAISQMFSKGTVSAEELRGQLGERLPGAFGIMAKSMGVSEQQLGKMMQKGEVMAKDVLPKFAEELEKTFGANASKNLETIGGAWNVLQTEISLYINEANKGGAITKQIAGAISFLAKNIDTIVSVLGKAIKAWITFKTVMYALNLQEQYSQWKGLKGAVNDTADGLVNAEKGAGKFGDALKGIGLTVFISLLTEAVKGLYDIASGAEDATLKVDQMNKAIANGKDFGSGVISDLSSRKTALDARLKNKKITQKQYEDELNDLKQASYKRVAWEIKVEKEEIASARAKIAKLKPVYDQVMAINPLFRDDAMMRIVANYNSETSAIKQSLSSIEALTVGYQGLDFNITENTGLTQKNTKAKKENTKEYKDAKEQIDALIESISKLDDFYLNSSIEENSKRLIQAIDLEMTKIGNSGEYSVDIINKIIEAEQELQKAVIERAYQTDIANAKNTADYELAEAKRNKALQDLDESTVEKKKETNKKLELEQERYAENQYKSEEERLKKEEELKKKADDAEKKRLEEMRNFRRQIFNELLDELKRQSEARESQYDKDIQTQKDFQSQLQAQANAGNITAQQSIAQSIEAEKKATIEKAKEQKKQQQIEDIKTLYNLINQNIDKGDNAGVATAKATASMSLIKGIAKLFQGFAKGTKWKLGDEDKPFMSGVDGHIVRVDSSEAIINGGLMNKAEKAGIKSTEQLVNSAVMYQNYNPQMMRMNDDRQGFNSSSAMMSIEPITQRLESLEQTIKNKVEFRIDPYIVNGIVKGVMETEKSKNLTRKNIYKS
jgi:tape measure domain-containing protein